MASSQVGDIVSPKTSWAQPLLFTFPSVQLPSMFLPEEPFDIYLQHSSVFLTRSSKVIHISPKTPTCHILHSNHPLLGINSLYSYCFSCCDKTPWLEATFRRKRLFWLTGPGQMVPGIHQAGRHNSQRQEWQQELLSFPHQRLVRVRDGEPEGQWDSTLCLQRWTSYSKTVQPEVHQTMSRIGPQN